MEILKNLGVISASIVGLIGAIYAIRRFLGTMIPIKISPSMCFDFEAHNNDSISAFITNKSKENIYIIECSAWDARPVKRALLRHLKRSFISPKFYRQVWYGCKRFSLLSERQIKLEPGESIELHHKLDFNRPLAGFDNSELLVVVKLSNGRIIKSNRLEVPEGWRTLFLAGHA